LPLGLRVVWEIEYPRPGILCLTAIATVDLPAPEGAEITNS